ncbi:hypothetical protein T265_04443 [Opisthorchis viverrini]|uniref:Uncharacterized protein n=1 Tax=Opisthorchis viverrini TaxID=6198 RepID=A0A075AGI4_OPIVI|nr:hypothetical protein T265_04443 [Opisthorchis viverrini]KER28749.1 hypothetical protein T265_04443 [Opisthorchis viverrini]
MLSMMMVIDDDDDVDDDDDMTKSSGPALQAQVGEKQTDRSFQAEAAIFTNRLAMQADTFASGSATVISAVSHLTAL